MNKLVLTLRVALLVMLPAVAARGQAPPNDIFFNAIPINGPIATVTGSNVGASKNFGGEPFLVGGSFGGASVWWTWTATASGQTTIDTEGSDFNTLLGVFTGTVPNQLTLIADNDNFEGNQWSRVMFNAVAGTTYRIVVDGFRTGGGPGGRAAQGNIVLHVKGVGGLELSVTNGMVFTVGDPIPVNVTITPDFPNPPATRVDFFRRSSPNLAPVQFASLTSAPFNAVATNLPAGSNTFYVVVFDMMGNPVQSPTVNVLVQNVGVTLLTPFEDTLLGPTNPLVATAWAYLPGGTITNVEFLLDGVKFAEDDTPPYSGTLSNVASGSHRLTAVGRSDTGARFTSQSVNLGVVSAFVAWGSVWRYLDDGSDQGTNWIAPHFEDDDWKYGPAELGYGDGDEATVVEDDPTPGYTPNANDRFITTYFRQTFDVSSTNGLAGLVMILERDDGGVVYLNGRELFRTPNMPQAPTNITYTTTTTDGIGIEDTIDAVFLSPTNLIIGANVFAVEIHQQAANSSDISFNLQLLGIPTIIHNLSPLVELTNPPPNSFFLAPTSINLGATAQDYDGSVAKVEFFVDGVKIDEDSTEPYTGVWNNPSFAAHVLTAVATDDQGATTTSTEIPVVVYDGNGTPVAAITSPADGFVTQGPTNWLVTATANAITG
ncbi:MAG TPA: Ig-like domain-containing protein, partial [Verrucomicrobiae bacterium]|nr:Ig-like domain-containing protein [Verrucomicrobiae bacterium]